jgi:hypothetical protein
LRKRFLAVLMAVAIAAPFASMLQAPATASPADEYAGPYFGDGNLPPGCIRDMSEDNPQNTCFHMLTGLNGLDSPQVDVLVLVPVSPTAERDMRIMRQSVEMWEAGIDYMASQMGLQWLTDGVDFHVTVDAIDPTGLTSMDRIDVTRDDAACSSRFEGSLLDVARSYELQITNDDATCEGATVAPPGLVLFEARLWRGLGSSDLGP